MYHLETSNRGRERERRRESGSIGQNVSFCSFFLRKNRKSDKESDSKYEQLRLFLSINLDIVLCLKLINSSFLYQ